MLEIIYSLLFIELLGLFIFPITFSVFWKLPDRGYSFSKLLSLILWVYLIWILGSFNANLNLQVASSIILIIFGIISFVTLYYNYRYILNYLKKNLTMIFLFDLCFILVFACWIFKPSINYSPSFIFFFQKVVKIFFINYSSSSYIN